MTTTATRRTRKPLELPALHRCQPSIAAPPAPPPPRPGSRPRPWRPIASLGETGLVGLIALALGIAIAPAIWTAVPELTGPQTTEVR